MKFKCKKCGNLTVEEIMEDAVVGTVINEIDDDDNIIYGEVNLYCGDVVRYQCESCCDTLITTNDTEDFLKFIKKYME